MSKKRLLIFLIFIFLFANLVNSDYEIGAPEYSITKSYIPGDSIKGWINISFNEELSDSEFEDSIGNKITLIDLLKSASDYNYKCSVADCTSEYSASSPAQTKNFSLNSNQEKLIGFKFDKKINDISSVSFKITSDSPADCKTQLVLDIFNDNEIEFGSNKSTNQVCESTKTYSCYNPSASSQSNPKIEKSPYKHCQRITLSASPAFEIGAWIKRNSDSRDVYAELYNLNLEPISNAKCKLPYAEESEVSCTINFSIFEPKEFYVCIYSDQEGAAVLKGYEDEDGCGFMGSRLHDESASFQIFAKGKKFNSFGQQEVKNELRSTFNFAAELKDYISS
jgi:hypothetical protein